jgi:peptidylprolyl isomerase
MRRMKASRGAVLFLSILILGSVVFSSGCMDSGSGNKSVAGEGSGNKSVAGEGSGNKSVASEGSVVKLGDSVQVDYVGKFQNGTIFDTSEEDVAKQAGLYNSNRTYVPLSFNVGSGQLIEGFDQGVIGMKVGEEKTLTIPPEKAYGEYNKSFIVPVPLENVSKDVKAGQKIPTLYGMVTVLEVNNTHAMIDFNHELAGKTLIFDVKLVSIEKA